MSVIHCLSDCHRAFELQDTKVSYGGTAAFNAGVGEKARADARIILEGVKTTVYQQRTKASDYVVWQRQTNQGSNTETLSLPSFTGKVNLPFQASGGISVQIPASDFKIQVPGSIKVQIPASDFKSQIATLSALPGMGYLSDLAARKDVNWQPVKLAHEQWNYKQEGLTPAGAALVAVAVALALPPGLGSSLMGTTGTMTTAMANAAFTSVAAQASITFINNKGDIAKTLKELGSSQTIKAAITAALTAGLLDQLGTANGMAEIKDKLKNGTAGISEKVTYNLINAGGRAVTTTAINGGNLEDALKQALVGGLVDTAHGQVASKFKVLESEYLAHKLAHALAGCVAGAAAGGACKDGAIGSAVGEVVAGMFKPANGMFFTEAEKTTVLGYSKLVAGAVSAYAGGNAQTAITTAEVAVRNNYLTDSQKQKKERELASCTTLVCAAGVAAKYGAISGAQDAALLIGVGGGIGYQSFEQAAALVDMLKNPSATFATLNALVNDPDFRARVGNQLADDYKARIALQVKAYNDGGWSGATTAGVEAGRLAVDVFSAATAAVGAGKMVATAAKAGGNAAVAAATLTADVTVNLLQNMALRNVQVGAINGFKSAEAVNATMKSVAGWEPAWMPGTQVADVTLKQGTRVSMVVTEADYNAIIAKGDTSKLGGWATYDNVTSQAYARNQLAITQGMKDNVGYVIEVEVTRPVYAQVGVVGSQGGASGGGNQLHFVVPSGERAGTFRVIGGKSLP